MSNNHHEHCLVCGVEKMKGYTCGHAEVVRFARRTKLELKARCDAEARGRKSEVSENLELYQELSEGAQFGICLLIAKVRLEMRKIRSGDCLGGVTGLELVMELVREGAL